MDYLNLLWNYTSVFYQGYIVSSLLNLLISGKLGQTRTSVQNLIGIFLVVGLLLYYLMLLIELAFSWYSGVEYNMYVLKGSTGQHKAIHLFMLVIPLITLLINSTKVLRTNYVVMALSYLMFLPQLYELFVILMTSPGITLQTINHVYLNPIINMILYGVAVYSISVFIASRRLFIRHDKPKQQLLEDL